MSVVKVLLNAHFHKVFDKGTVFCLGFVIQCQGCTCAGWLWEGEGGLGDHQPGVYVPLKALFLVLCCMFHSTKMVIWRCHLSFILKTG